MNRMVEAAHQIPPIEVVEVFVVGRGLWESLLETISEQEPTPVTHPLAVAHLHGPEVHPSDILERNQYSKMTKEQFIELREAGKI